MNEFRDQVDFNGVISPGLRHQHQNIDQQIGVVDNGRFIDEQTLGGEFEDVQNVANSVDWFQIGAHDVNDLWLVNRVLKARKIN